jgi:hypothetical protein
MNNLRKQLGLDKPKPKPVAAAAAGYACPPAPKGKRDKPERFEADEQAYITPACGHRLGVKSLRQAVCPACQTAKRIAKNKARSLARPWGKHVPTRLPDNSRFDVLYDAATESWTGTLTAGAVTFEASDSAVFGLLVKLDRLYRQSLEPAQAG